MRCDVTIACEICKPYLCKFYSEWPLSATLQERKRICKHYPRLSLNLFRTVHSTSAKQQTYAFTTDGFATATTTAVTTATSRLLFVVMRFFVVVAPNDDAIWLTGCCFGNIRQKSIQLRLYSVVVFLMECHNSRVVCGRPSPLACATRLLSQYSKSCTGGEAMAAIKQKSMI